MTATRSARERKLAEAAGPAAKVSVHFGKRDQAVCKIVCRIGCQVGGTNWTTYRSGQSNSFIPALDRWALHLDKRHPEVDAPCLAYLEDAKERLQVARAAD